VLEAINFKHDSFLRARAHTHTHTHTHTEKLTFFHSIMQIFTTTVSQLKATKLTWSQHAKIFRDAQNGFSRTQLETCVSAIWGIYLEV
jgi:hypothetical protein